MYGARGILTAEDFLRIRNVEQPRGRIEEWTAEDAEAWAWTIQPDADSHAESLDFGTGKGLGLDLGMIARRFRDRKVDGQALAQLCGNGGLSADRALSAVLPNAKVRAVVRAHYLRSVLSSLAAEEVHLWTASRLALFVSVLCQLQFPELGERLAHVLSPRVANAITARKLDGATLLNCCATRRSTRWRSRR